MTDKKIDTASKTTTYDLLALTSDIVAAHLSNNSMGLAEIPNFIHQIFQTLTSIDSGRARLGERPQPAVAIKKSVTPEHIVCLEDGKKLKMLKRHLKTSFNMTPEEYRERWSLPPDYPMVAPNYARQRSSLAKDIGLGRRRLKQAA